MVITAQAQQLQGAQTKMASLPEVDQKKVAEIKQAIAEGRYKIDPEKLAANIASFEAELNDLNKVTMTEIAKLVDLQHAHLAVLKQIILKEKGALVDQNADLLLSC